MEDKELYRKNRLIAGFHGWSINLATSIGDPFCYFPKKYEELKKLAGEYSMLGTSQLKYHESWDWLMPIVLKIEALGHAVEICQNSCVIYEHDRYNSLNEQISVMSGSKIAATFENIVQFVELYNKTDGGRK